MPDDLNNAARVARAAGDTNTSANAPSPGVEVASDSDRVTGQSGNTSRPVKCGLAAPVNQDKNWPFRQGLQMLRLQP